MLYLVEEVEPWIRPAKVVIDVDNGFCGRSAGKPKSPLHRASVALRDLKQGFASWVRGERGADEVLDAGKQTFAVMFSDDVIEPTVAMREMIRVRKEHGGSVLLAVEVEPSQVSNYSVFDVEATDDDRVKKVVGMVEKPAV